MLQRPVSSAKMDAKLKIAISPNSLVDDGTLLREPWWETPNRVRTAFDLEKEMRYASHIRRVARYLKELYSPMPFYAQRAARQDDGYWINWAQGAPNILP